MGRNRIGRVDLTKYSFGQHVLAAMLGLLSTHASGADNHALFQNRFFKLSQDNSLVCATSEEGFKTLAELKTIIRYYEGHFPKLRRFAVAVLTDHADARHLDDLQAYRETCQTHESVELCLLEHYWDDEEAALRALALFYDTKTIVKHSDLYDIPRFSVDHLRLFEKGIRKIPYFLRQSISKAKPLEKFAEVVQTLPLRLQPLVSDAMPEDYHSSLWSDHTYPLKLVPGKGYGQETVAQVFSGQNLIIFTVKAFDKGKDGRMYRDINLKYLVDFRLPILVHEIAHTIDNFHYWNGQDDLYFFYQYRKISNDNKTVQIIKEAKLALWPSKWFEAFEYLWEVNQGRYNGRIQEKLAELVAQYILLPEKLKLISPDAYQWLRGEVFQNLEYQGYDSCTSPVTETLDFWQDAVAKVLGH